MGAPHQPAALTAASLASELTRSTPRSVLSQKCVVEQCQQSFCSSRAAWQLQQMQEFKRMQDVPVTMLETPAMPGSADPFDESASCSSLSHVEVTSAHQTAATRE